MPRPKIVSAAVSQYARTQPLVRISTTVAAGNRRLSEENIPDDGGKDDRGINQRPLRRAAQFVHFGEMAGQRLERGRQLGRSLARRDDRADMRGKLFFEKAARLVDRQTRTHLALDFFEHRARWSRWGVGGKLGESGIGGDAGAQLQLQLVKEADKIPGRETDPPQFPIGLGRFDLDRPEVLGAQALAQLRRVGGVVYQQAAASQGVDDRGGEGGHIPRGRAAPWWTQAAG